jgi:ribosomal protein S18 acetylase RimI-like enzyme
MAGKELLNDKSYQRVKPFRLRDYRSEDFDELCRIDRLCFEREVAYTAEEMAAFLGAPGAVALVAEDARGRVAAFLVAHRGRIITVDVAPGRRRRGLGAALIRLCERRLRAAGARTVRLETAAGNRAAQALYESLGYTQVRRLARYYPTGEDAWVMEKSLVRS